MKQINYISKTLFLAFIFLLCSCNNDYGCKKYVIKDVSHPCDILLCVDDTTVMPSRIMINIIGVVNGECSFEIENGEKRYESIKLCDTIDYVYKNDWYVPEINIKYNPASGITGDSIVILYQMT